jgi:hypothetical protein
MATVAIERHAIKYDSRTQTYTDGKYLYWIADCFVRDLEGRGATPQAALDDLAAKLPVGLLRVQAHGWGPS